MALAPLSHKDFSYLTLDERESMSPIIVSLMTDGFAIHRERKQWRWVTWVFFGVVMVLAFGNYEIHALWTWLALAIQIFASVKGHLLWKEFNARRLRAKDEATEILGRNKGARFAKDLYLDPKDDKDMA